MRGHKKPAMEHFEILTQADWKRFRELQKKLLEHERSIKK